LMFLVLVLPCILAANVIWIPCVWNFHVS